MIFYRVCDDGGFGNDEDGVEYMMVTVTIMMMLSMVEKLITTMALLMFVGVGTNTVIAGVASIRHHTLETDVRFVSKLPRSPTPKTMHER